MLRYYGRCVRTKHTPVKSNVSAGIPRRRHRHRHPRARIVARMSACRSACHGNNFRKSRVSDGSARILARMSVSVYRGIPALPSVGPRADPGVQAVSPQVIFSHPSGGRLPLLSASSYGYLSSHRAPPPIGRYQIILLGVTDRGTCMRAACPRLLPGRGPTEI